MSVNDLHLILQVQHNPVLYDTTQDGFRDRDLKEMAWVAIGSSMGVDPQECKTRWNYLRQRYSVELKNQKEKDKTKRRTIFPMFQSMNFLEPFVKPRMRMSAHSDDSLGPVSMVPQYQQVMPYNHDHAVSQFHHHGYGPNPEMDPGGFPGYDSYPRSSSSLRSASDDGIKIEQFLEDEGGAPEDQNGAPGSTGSNSNGAPPAKISGSNDDNLDSEDEEGVRNRTDSAFSAIRANSVEAISGPCGAERPGGQSDELPNEPLGAEEARAESSSRNNQGGSASASVVDPDPIAVPPMPKQLRLAADPRCSQPGPPGFDPRFMALTHGLNSLPRYGPPGAPGPHHPYFSHQMQMISRGGPSGLPGMHPGAPPAALPAPAPPAPPRDELDHFAAHLVSEMRLLPPEKQALVKIRIHEALYHVRFGPVPKTADEPAPSPTTPGS